MYASLNMEFVTAIVLHLHIIYTYLVLLFTVKANMTIEQNFSSVPRYQGRVIFMWTTVTTTEAKSYHFNSNSLWVINAAEHVP